MNDAIAHALRGGLANARADRGKAKAELLGGGHRGLLNRGELAVAAAQLDRMAATVAMISPDHLPALDEPPPEPYRMLSVTAPANAVSSSDFAKLAWPMIGQNAAVDPTVTGEPVGYIEAREGDQRVLRVYFTAPEAEAGTRGEDGTGDH